METLVAIALIGISIQLILTLLNHLCSETRSVNIRLQILAQKNLIRTSLSDPNVCSCLLSPLTNSHSSKTLYINPKIATPPDIDLDILRSGCSQTSSDNIVAQKDHTFGSKLLPVIVNRVYLSDIRATGQKDEYLGRVKVDISATKEIALAPMTTPVRFSINSVSGTANKRPIAGCIVPMSHLGVSVCPDDFKLVGTPGDMNALCVEDKPRTATSFFDALKQCQQIQKPGFTAASVCDDDQWRNACLQKMLSGSSGPEMINYLVGGDGINAGSAVTVKLMSPSNCGYSLTSPDPFASGKFRCCI